MPNRRPALCSITRQPSAPPARSGWPAPPSAAPAWCSVGSAGGGDGGGRGRQQQMGKLRLHAPKCCTKSTIDCQSTAQEQPTEQHQLACRPVQPLPSTYPLDRHGLVHIIEQLAKSLREALREVLQEVQVGRGHHADTACSSALLPPATAMPTQLDPADRQARKPQPASPALPAAPPCCQGCCTAPAEHSPPPAARVAPAKWRRGIHKGGISRTGGWGPEVCNSCSTARHYLRPRTAHAAVCETSCTQPAPQLIQPYLVGQRPGDVLEVLRARKRAREGEAACVGLAGMWFSQTRPAAEQTCVPRRGPGPSPPSLCNTCHTAHQPAYTPGL